jgi:hypothetical protein
MKGYGVTHFCVFTDVTQPGDWICKYELHCVYGVVKMTNFLAIIHRRSLIKNTRRFGDWSLSLSSGKRTPALLGLIDRASPHLRR